MPERPEPIILEAPAAPPDRSKGAAIIFIHGLGDEGAAWETTAKEFQTEGKLPYLKWVLPTAPENRDALETAWFYPTSLSYPPGRPELADDPDEDGMLRSRKEIEALIDQVVSEGYPLNRIVLGGFSQGCAMTLLTGFTSSKHAGKLGGLCALGGFLPLANKILELRQDSDLPASFEDWNVPIFLMRGGKDMLIPRSCLTETIEKAKEFGIKEDLLIAKEYPGVGHAVTPTILGDVMTWLKTVVPPL